VNGDTVTLDGDPRPPFPTGESGVVVEAGVDGHATEAWMIVRREPTDPPPPAASDGDGDAPDPGATALARAGVVHGIDAAAVADALAAADGSRRIVARATPPRPPVDALVTRPDAAAADADPLFSVPAGALLAHRTPARDGAPGTDVRGAQIAPAAPRVLELTAGPGARAIERDDGTLEVHATEEGRPVWRGAVAAVEGTLRAAAVDGGGAARHVHGGLTVAGDVGEGANLSVSGVLTVAGLVTHAHITAEGGVVVMGSCVGTNVRAGARRAAAARLAGALRSALDDLATLGSGATQLLSAAAQGPRPLRPAAAVRMLIDRRHASLPDVWRGLATALRADAAVAGVPDDAPALVDTVARAFADAHGTVTPEGIAGWRAALTPTAVALAHTSSGSSDVRVGYLQASRVETPGDLIVTGAGTYNTDVEIGGDLVAEAPGATVRGGDLRVAGTVRVAELGAPGGARVVVTLLGPPAAGMRLVARVAHQGAEVVVAGRIIRIERRTLNLVVGCDEDNGVVHSGDPSP